MNKSKRPSFWQRNEVSMIYSPCQAKSSHAVESKQRREADRKHELWADQTRRHTEEVKRQQSQVALDGQYARAQNPNLVYAADPLKASAYTPITIAEMAEAVDVPVRALLRWLDIQLEERFASGADILTEYLADVILRHRFEIYYYR